MVIPKPVTIVKEWRNNMTTLQKTTVLAKLRSSETNRKIYNFLAAHRSGVLATNGPDYAPQASVIYYDVEKDLTIRFLTKKFTKKSANLQLNPLAALVVYDEPTQTTVQISGEVSDISDMDEVSDVFRKVLRASLHTSSSNVPPISKLNAGEYIVYELVPNDVKMASFLPPKTGGHEDLFQSAELPI
jgi:nitroimidazol reductase NimA-like FMN-containing flavoprotein (pyridoxamine 5'-phosphate oxidase superfamily)